MAIVDENGLVTGIQVGEATISDAIGEITASVTIQVLADEPGVMTIIVTPESISVERGENVLFSATVLDQFSREIRMIKA